MSKRLTGYQFRHENSIVCNLNGPSQHVHYNSTLNSTQKSTLSRSMAERLLDEHGRIFGSLTNKFDVIMYEKPLNTPPPSPVKKPVIKLQISI